MSHSFCNKVASQRSFPRWAKTSRFWWRDFSETMRSPIMNFPIMIRISKKQSRIMIQPLPLFLRWSCPSPGRTNAESESAIFFWWELFMGSDYASEYSLGHVFLWMTLVMMKKYAICWTLNYNASNRLITAKYHLCIHSFQTVFVDYF